MAGHGSDDAGGRLVRLDAANWRDALSVRVSDEQLPMVADSQPIALVILAKAYVREGDREWEALGYRTEDDGFVAVLGVTYDGDTAEIRNFAVDVDHQRRGIGLRVIRRVVDHVRLTGIRTLVVTAHPGNKPAIACYERAGFMRTGELRGIEPVLQLEVE